MAIADSVKDTAKEPATAPSDHSASRGVDDAVLAAALDEFEDAGVDLGAALPASDATIDADAVIDTATLAHVEPAGVAEPVAATDPATPTSPSVAPVVDPLADTAPLDYTLDGQARAFDGILVDKKNGGAFILPDKLEAVRTRLIEGDRLAAQLTPLQTRIQDYDNLAYRWTQKDDKGADHQFELKGFQAFERLTADAAANSAAGLFLLKTLSEAFPGKENAAALLNIFKQADFEHRRVGFEAAQRFRNDFSQRKQSAQATATTATDEATWFTGALSQIRSALPALTAADMEAGRQFFAKRPQLVYRNATAQDAAKLGVRIGERIGDPEAMNEWYSERAALRAEEAKKTAALATATGTAGKHNAGMDKGRQPARQPAQARTAGATPAATIPEKVDRRAQWSSPLKTALQEMGID